MQNHTYHVCLLYCKNIYTGSHLIFPSLFMIRLIVFWSIIITLPFLDGIPAVDVIQTLDNDENKMPSTDLFPAIETYGYIPGPVDAYNIYIEGGKGPQMYLSIDDETLVFQKYNPNKSKWMPIVLVYAIIWCHTIITNHTQISFNDCTSKWQMRDGVGWGRGLGRLRPSLPSCSTFSPYSISTPLFHVKWMIRSHLISGW